jgi:hypothetical protein
MVFGRGDLDDLRDKLAGIPLRQESASRLPSQDDVLLVEEIMRGRGFPTADLLGHAAELDLLADRLTEQQALMLDVSRLIRRLEVRGGAGSGKTWLALEQARRLQRHGERVALMCYSRGLATCFSRITAQWRRKERPAYVGTFHGLGTDYFGLEQPAGGDADSDYWENRLPQLMVDAGHRAPVGHRFDAMVVDEAQTRGSGSSAGPGRCRNARPASSLTTTCATPGRSLRRSPRWPRTG